MTLDQLSDLDISGLRRLTCTTSRPDTTVPTDRGKVPAISYLRVSTKDQATRNGLGKGILLSDQRDRLEAERLKPVQAHYADAIPSRASKTTSASASIRSPPGSNKFGPAHRTPGRPLQQMRTSRTTHPQPRPVHSHHRRRRRNAINTPGLTTTSVLAHINIDAPAEVTTETKLPHHQVGKVQIFSSWWSIRESNP